MAELHGLSGGCALVQQRGVGHRHACDVTDHGLVVQQGLQPTLGDLGLVGRVLGYPGEREGGGGGETDRQTEKEALIRKSNKSVNT